MSTGTAEHVQQIARRATAHNYGQTVWGIDRIGDTRWLLRMSSWPRCQEAATALRTAGYTADVVTAPMTDAIDVTWEPTP